MGARGRRSRQACSNICESGWLINKNPGKTNGLEAETGKNFSWVRRNYLYNRSPVDRFKANSMARHFNYYDPWRTELLYCNCGWSGTFEQGLVEAHSSLMDSECPRCSTLIALVLYPTAEEIEQHEPDSSGFKQRVRQAGRRLEALRTLGLKSTEQLPEVSAREFFLEWDFETDGLDDKWTVLRHAGGEIFREPAFWEGWQRYMEVAAICQQKYAFRLKDLRPTERSLLYLLGDSLSAAGKIAEFRRINFPDSK